MKIIGHCVDYHSPAHNFIGREAVGHKGKLRRAAFVGKQRRHIPRMAGVRAASLVIMTSRICKRVLGISAALTTAVYVHTKDLAAAPLSHRQTVDRKGRHSFAEVWHENRIPENIGIFFTASYDCF